MPGTTHPPLFGSAGFLKLVERFHHEAGSTGIPSAKPPIFRREALVVKNSPSIGLVRLEELRQELSAVIEGTVPEDLPSIFQLAEHPLPSLKIADLAIVYVQPEIGSYSLRENGSITNALVTSSKERLFDYIVSILAIEAHKTVCFTQALAVGLLTGQTLADVERHLILNSLRVFGGSHSKACHALGISESDLRIKLESALDNTRLRALKL
jgi:hypothetical protein